MKKTRILYCKLNKKSCGRNNQKFQVIYIDALKHQLTIAENDKVFLTIPLNWVKKFYFVKEK